MALGCLLYTLPDFASLHASECDLRRACWFEHFDTPEDAAACFADAQALIDDLKEECEAEADETAPEEEQTSCKEACDAVTDGCNEDCGEAYDECSTPCFSLDFPENVACFVACAEAETICSEACPEALPCQHNCEKIFLETVEPLRVARLACEAEACAASEEHPTRCTAACDGPALAAGMDAEIAYYSCVNPCVIGYDEGGSFPGEPPHWIYEEGCEPPCALSRFIATSAAENEATLCRYNCGLQLKYSTKACLPNLGTTCEREAGDAQRRALVECGAMAFGELYDPGAVVACQNAANDAAEDALIQCFFYRMGSNAYDRPWAVCQRAYRDCTAAAGLACEDLARELDCSFGEFGVCCDPFSEACIEATAAWHACVDGPLAECGSEFVGCKDEIEADRPGCGKGFFAPYT